MPSIVGGLFGKKGNASTSSTPTGYESLPDFGQQFLQDIIKQGQGYTAQNTGFNPAETAAYQALASGNPAANAVNAVGGFGFGKQANQAFGDSSNAYNTAQGYVAGAMPFLQRGGTAITSGDISGSISDFMNPYTDSVINNTTRDIAKYGEGLFSNARGLISDAGASGSNRAQFLASDIADNQMKQVGDFSSQLRNTGFQSAANNALARLQSDKSNALNAGTGMINAGGQQANIGQGYAGLGNNLMSARMNMDVLRNNARTNTIGDLQNQATAGQALRTGTSPANLQMLSELMKLIPVGGGGSTYGGSAPTQGLLGSGGFTNSIPQLASSAISFFSDARLKEGIEKVGEKDGINIYHFNYKGDTKRYSGVMAQEVSHIDGAVTMGEDGYLRVNYDVIGIPFEEIA